VLEQQRGKHRRWVFPYKGHAMENPAQDAYKAAVRAAGLPAQFDWHSLRHTWASWHVQNGTPLAVLMQLGGWASYAMVLRYAHLGVDHTAAWVNNSLRDKSVTSVTRNANDIGHYVEQFDESHSEKMGWLMGLEPTTTGITIRDSTN